MTPLMSSIIEQMCEQPGALDSHVIASGAAMASDHIRSLEAACQLVRETMNTQANGGSGWMAEFERLAFQHES